jgi:hypothetical protein
LLPPGFHPLPWTTFSRCSLTIKLSRIEAGD